jgi:hypothetical protein
MEGGVRVESSCHNTHYCNYCRVSWNYNSNICPSCKQETLITYLNWDNLDKWKGAVEKHGVERISEKIMENCKQGFEQ